MIETIASVGDPQRAAVAENMPPSPIPTSLRDRLRQGSAQEHARLDARLGAIDLATARGYARFLTIHSAGLAAVQPAAAAFIGASLGLALPDARAMVAADLREMGLAEPAGAAPPIDPAQGAGAAYVLLGSRMGMGVISRGVHLPPGACGRYLFDRSLGALWRPMRDWLQAAPAQGPLAEAALAGTQAAFAAFTAAAGIGPGA